MILFAGSLFVSSLLAIWSVDVLVNLSLAEQIRAPALAAARPEDFIGLFQADIPVALFLTAAALLLGRALSLIFRHRDTKVESAAAAGAGLSFAVVLAGAGSSGPWMLPATRIPLAIAAAGGAAILLWPLFRMAFLQRARNGTLFFHDLLLLAPLCLGLVNTIAAALVLDGQTLPLSAALLTPPFLGALLLAASNRFRLAGRALAALPVLSALLLSALLSLGPFLPSQAGERLPGAREEAAKPDIALIVLDTVRADRLARYGHDRDTMPHLEKWSAGAFVAERAVSPAGWTAPAHASLFSGMGVSGHGVHNGRSRFVSTAFEGIPWLPSLLSAEGYSCVALSANTLALPEEVEGFHRKIVPDRKKWLNSTIGALFEKYVLGRNPLSERLRWRRPYADARSMTDIAIRYAAPAAEPLFLFVNFLDAHSPYNPPARSLEELGVTIDGHFPRFANHRDLSQGWEALPQSRSRNLAALYDGELRWLDTHLARLLRWIEDNLGEDTIVILTSDHGEELGEEGRVGHEFGLSQTLIHVPLFIARKGLAPSTDKSVLAISGLYDYILAAARGGNSGPEILLEGSAEGVLSERYTSGANSESLGAEYGRPWVSLIDGNLKGVGPSAFGFRLYDLGLSGFSSDSLHPEPGEGGTLSDRIDTHWSRSEDRRKEAPDARQDLDREKLRSLGYMK